MSRSIGAVLQSEFEFLLRFNPAARNHTLVLSGSRVKTESGDRNHTLVLSPVACQSRDSALQATSMGVEA